MLAAVSASGVGDDHAFRSGVPIRGNWPSPVAACFLYGTFRGRVCADFPFGFPARGARRDRSLLRFFDRLFPAVAVSCHPVADLHLVVIGRSGETPYGIKKEQQKKTAAEC